MNRLLVLLRGVNVSGHNKVPMAELRKVLTDAGFENVATYIQSGNIALDTGDDPSTTTDRIRQLLAEHFGVDVPVISVDQSTVAELLEASPFDLDQNPAHQLIYFPGAPVDIAGFEDLDTDRFVDDKITPTSAAVYVLSLIHI